LKNENEPGVAEFNYEKVLLILRRIMYASIRAIPITFHLLCFRQDKTLQVVKAKGWER